MWTGLWVFLSGLAIALIAPAVTHAIKLAEFRQAWINELREDVAEYLGHARKWARSFEGWSILDEKGAPHSEIEAKAEEVASFLNDARVVMWRIQMRINPNENNFSKQDQEFLKALVAVTYTSSVKPTEPELAKRWHDLADELVVQSRALLKREWDVTKEFPLRRLYHATLRTIRARTV